MKILLLTLTVLAASIGSATAARPASTSICDYYATALFGNANATNAKQLVSAVVTRAVLGGSGNSVTVVGLVGSQITLPFFNSSINYRYAGGPNGNSPAPNFLTDTAAYNALASKLVAFFGVALNCTAQGGSDYPTYSGASMWLAHKGMPITQTVMTEFINQVGGSAKSYGVEDADVTAVANLLASFNRGSFTSDGTPAYPSAQNNVVCNDVATCSCADAQHVGAQCRPKVAAASTRPTGTTICDYYTAALGNAPSSPVDEYNLIQAIVLRAITGGSANSVTVEGLANSNITKKFFDGSVNYRSSVMNDKPAGSGSTSPNFLVAGPAQSYLVGHLIQFFGTALGCSAQSSNSTDFPPYGGVTSMQAVHSAMPISNAVMQAFITQVANSAKSFGVQQVDLDAVGTLLNTFNRAQTSSGGVVATAICNQPDCPCAAGYNTSDSCKPNAGTNPGSSSSTGTTSSSTGGTGPNAASSLVAFSIASFVSLLAAMFALRM